MDTERCARFCAMIVCWSAPYPLVGSVTKGYVTWSCASSSCPILSIPIRASVALRLSSENKDDGVEDHEEPGSWQDASDIPVREENEKRSLPPRPTNQHGRHGTQGPGERGRKRFGSFNNLSSPPLPIPCKPRLELSWKSPAPSWSTDCSPY